jgi:hypothetical protein
LIYSTYLGIGAGDGIAIDKAGNAYVTGSTNNRFFPTKYPLQKNLAGSSNAFVSKLNATGSGLFYSTYLGGSVEDYGVGIAVDSARNTYVSGEARSANFPVTPGAFQTVCNGGSKCDQAGDAFVAKLNILAPTLTKLSSAPNPSTFGQPVTFTAVVTSKGLNAPPDGDTVAFVSGTTQLGTAVLSGGTASFTTSTLKVGTHSVRAVYEGDLDFANSASTPVRQVVNKAE